MTPCRTEDALRNRDARHVIPVSGGQGQHRSCRLPVAVVPQDAVRVRVLGHWRGTAGNLQLLRTARTRLGGIGNSCLGIRDVRCSQEAGGRTPFDVVLYEHFAGFLPGPHSRWCTRMLKIHPFENFIGTDPAFSYIAIRADESRRGYTGTGAKPVVISEKPNITPVYPFRDEGFAIADIQRILDESGLGLPEYYEWRSRSGCYFCFYQQIAEWQGLSERHPNLFEKAKAYEKKSETRGYTWVDGRSLEDVERLPRRTLKSKSDEEGCAICHL